MFTSEKKTPNFPLNSNPPLNSNKIVEFTNKEPHLIRINKEKSVKAQPQ